MKQRVLFHSTVYKKIIVDTEIKLVTSQGLEETVDLDKATNVLRKEARYIKLKLISYLRFNNDIGNAAKMLRTVMIAFDEINNLLQELSKG